MHVGNLSWREGQRQRDSGSSLRLNWRTAVWPACPLTARSRPATECPRGNPRVRAVDACRAAGRAANTLLPRGTPALRGYMCWGPGRTRNRGGNDGHGRHFGGRIPEPIVACTPTKTPGSTLFARGRWYGPRPSFQAWWAGLLGPVTQAPPDFFQTPNFESGSQSGPDVPLFPCSCALAPV